MKLTRIAELEIDIEAERKRIKYVEYTREEKLALLKLCDFFEVGMFQEARTYISHWDKEWHEYINVEMWNVLMDESWEIAIEQPS